MLAIVTCNTFHNDSVFPMQSDVLFLNDCPPLIWCGTWFVSFRKTGTISAHTVALIISWALLHLSPRLPLLYSEQKMLPSSCVCGRRAEWDSATDASAPLTKLLAPLNSSSSQPRSLKHIHSTFCPVTLRRPPRPLPDSNPS